MTGPVLVLVGPPASGKTTVGTALAAALGVGFRDTDADVEAESGSSVADLFVSQGEPHFRALEEQAVARALAGHEGVVALGGGSVLSGATRELLRVRAAMKPISTIPRALATVDVATGEAAVAINQRSDACAVPRGSVVMEAMVALVLADAVLEKFGGDSVAETRRNARAYLDSLPLR